MQRRSLIKAILLSPLISMLQAESKGSEVDRQMRDNYELRPTAHSNVNTYREAFLEDHARNIENALFFGVSK